jgi:hypothetical protein
VPYSALAVTNDNQRRKAKPPTALDHLGHTVDMDQLFLNFRFFPRHVIAAAPAA